MSSLNTPASAPRPESRRVLEPVRAGDHPVYAVAGGNHVTVLLPREVTGGSLDVIEVLAQPGGGPPPHRHAFGEWFIVLEGALTLCERQGDVVRPTSTLEADDAVWVEPWTVHGTLNLSPNPTRFRVVGQPGAMSGYFAEAGTPVANELTPPTHPPAGPAQLGDIAARWGIEFWTKEVSETPAS